MPVAGSYETRAAQTYAEMLLTYGRYVGNPNGQTPHWPRRQDAGEAHLHDWVWNLENRMKRTTLTHCLEKPLP